MFKKILSLAAAFLRFLQPAVSLLMHCVRTHDLFMTELISANIKAASILKN